MAKELKPPEVVEYFFEQDTDYRIFAVNGIWGGITPRGDIQVDFFVEKQGIPESVKHRITDRGIVGDEIERKPDRRIVRHLQVGILLSLEEAESFAAFLGSRVEQLKKLKEGK